MAEVSGQSFTVTQVCAAPKPTYSQCLAMKRVAATKSTPGARPMLVHASLAAGTAGGVNPSDLATAYGVHTDTATSRVVAIVDAFDNPGAKSDLNTFDTQYGLAVETASSFRRVSQTGSTTLFPLRPARKSLTNPLATPPRDALGRGFVSPAPWRTMLSSAQASRSCTQSCPRAVTVMHYRREALVSQPTAVGRCGDNRLTERATSGRPR